MRIREATGSDAEAISRLVSELAREFLVGELTEQGGANLLASMSPAAVAQNLSAAFDWLVAEESSADGTRLVGVVGTRDDTHLYHLFVAASHQRRGLARRLWGRARERCIERSGTRRFTVNASTYAQEVYARLGFRPAGPVTERNGVVFHPMVLELDG